MTTDGGGWTVFQRRLDGSIDFNRDWADYKGGFGDLNGEFWQGNDVISRLTTARDSMLRVDMLDWESQPGYATYSLFRVENESNNYLLRVNAYKGNVGDSLIKHNGKKFSTRDRDNDASPGNCALKFTGFWWFDYCLKVNLNGKHGDFTYGKGIIWRLWHGTSYSLSRTEMKLRSVHRCIK